MDWDWQFLTPSSTPTTASFECGTPRHFQDAFSPYIEQQLQQHQHQQLQLQQQQQQQQQQQHQYQHQPQPQPQLQLQLQQLHQQPLQQHTSATPLGPALDFGDHPSYPHDAPHTQNYIQTYGHQQQPLQPAFAPQAQNSHGLAAAAPIGKDVQGLPPTASMHSTSSAESYQMHTPPPTRGSSTKRRSQRTESVTAFGTPASMTGCCSSQHDQQAHVQTQMLPFAALSATMPGQHDPSQSQNQSQNQSQAQSHGQPQYHFPGPSSAPQMLDLRPNTTFAQPRPINNHNNPQMWTGLDDPFAAALAQPAVTRPQEQPAYPAATGLRRSNSQQSRQLSVDTTASLNYGRQSFTARSSPIKAQTTSASVDPSLVYSSPSRPTTSDSMQSSRSSRTSLSSSSVGGVRVPYQHGLDDPRQEIGSARASRFKPPQAPAQSQSPTRSHTQSIPARPELQRSNTVGSLRSNVGHANFDPMQSGMLTRSNSTVNLPRRSSPLKRERVNRASLSSISETPKPAVRTSVVLKVDENGNARTETRVIESSPTKSIRDKYPILWDDSDSDSDALPSLRPSAQWPSRNSSLAHTRGEERHAKVAKLEPPLEDLENLHLPRSNSTASLRTPSKAAYAAAAQLRRQTSAKKQHPRQSIHARRNTLASLNSSFESLPSVDLSSSDDRSTQTDAGSALRQMMAGRGSSNGDMQQAQQQDTVPSNDRKPPSMIYEPRKAHQKSQSYAAPTQHYHNQAFSRAPVFSVDCAPMQPAMPSPEHAANYMHPPMFRCICNLPLDDGRGTLQCSFCAMYLHAACLGYDPQRLPNTYICNFCSNTANNLPTNSAQSFPGWGIAGI